MGVFRILDTIKEYLVGLGFQVENKSLNEAKHAMDGFEKSVKSFAAEATVSFGKAGLAVAGFVAAGVAGISKFVNDLGNQEIQMQMLSRTLWTTQQNAYAFSLTLKAMGATLQELYLSPTLMKQYRELNSLALGMTPPSGYQNEMHFVQSITLEFKKMKLEASYAMQWVGYYFIKDMAGPMGDVRSELQKLNHFIIKDMPIWTKTIAKWLASFSQGAIYVWDALKNIYHILQTVAGYLPTWVKVIIGAFAALDVVMASNPFFLMIEGLSAVLLLLDDYYTWAHGGKSALGGFWSSLTDTVQKFYGMLKQNGTVSDFKKMMATLKDDLSGVQSGLEKIGIKLGKNGQFTSGMQTAANIVDDLVKGLTELLNLIGQIESLWTKPVKAPNPSQEVTPWGQPMVDSNGNPVPKGTVHFKTTPTDRVDHAGAYASEWITKAVRWATRYKASTGDKTLFGKYGYANNTNTSNHVTVGSTTHTTNIHIHGNADASKVAQQSSDAVKTQLNLHMHNLRHLIQ